MNTLKTTTAYYEKASKREFEVATDNLDFNKST
jgi:hypothetical protein